MNPIIKLTNSTNQSETIEAKFSPERGMNLISLKIREIELLDQTTENLFQSRNAGLGALIGPHFHHRENPTILNNLSSLFPHIKNLPMGQRELFSHGIARYVPWKYDFDTTQIQARLFGSDLFHSLKIKEIEGIDFEMHFDAKVVHDGLLIDYRISSEKPSVIGFHYYYRLKNNPILSGLTEPIYRSIEGNQVIKKENYDNKYHRLHLPINQDLDWSFFPFIEENSSSNIMILNQMGQKVSLEYSSSNDLDSSFQVYHPKGASFVCLEPLSSYNPKSPTALQSRIQLKISLY